MLDAPTVSFEQYRALLWVRSHQPTHWTGPDAPPQRIKVALLQGGLIGLSAERRRFDPLTYSLSEQGEKVLARDEYRS